MLWFGRPPSASEWPGPDSVIAVPVMNRSLLLVRNLRRSGWEFPGGGILDGESPEQAARREAAEEAGACLGEAGDVFFGFDDHQMHVQQFRRGLADGLHHRESERDVGDEYAVHDVDMHPFGGASVDHLRIAFQVAEIGRQHRGGYDSLHGFDLF